MPVAAIAGIAAAGSIASGVIGANAAGHAADTQAAAANNAAALERQSAVDALNFNKLQYGNSLNLLSPFYNTGTAANSRLAYLMGLTPNQGLPPGVVNPNAPQPTSGVGGSLADRIAAFRNGDFGGDAVLPAGGSGGGGMLIANRFGGTVPRTDFASNGAGAPNAGNIPGSTTGPLSGPNAGLGINPGQGALSPNDPGSSLPNGGFGINPGQAAINPNDPGGITATTNQGGTGQVPRLDGGGQPGVSPPTSGPGSFGSLAQGWNQTFQSPTDVTEQNDPGYQFRLAQGQQALQNSAAARGGLLSGGTAKALNDYAQNQASSEYGNVYNRALQNYNTNYNTFTNDQNNLFNRLQALSGGGQTSANQLSASGITSANNAANIGLTSAGQIGQQYNNAGAATASGYIGGANAITGAIGQGANSLSTLALLQMLKGGGSGGGNMFSTDPSICWVAEELYGVDSPKTHAIRAWLTGTYRHDPIGRQFVWLYERHGQKMAELIKHDSDLRTDMKHLFDAFAEQAMPAKPEDFESVRYQR